MEGATARPQDSEVKGASVHGQAATGVDECSKSTKGKQNYVRNSSGRKWFTVQKYNLTFKNDGGANFEDYKAYNGFSNINPIQQSGENSQRHSKQFPHPHTKNGLSGSYGISKTGSKEALLPPSFRKMQKKDKQIRIYIASQERNEHQDSKESREDNRSGQFSRSVDNKSMIKDLPMDKTQQMHSINLYDQYQPSHEYGQHERIPSVAHDADRQGTELKRRQIVHQQQNDQLDIPTASQDQALDSHQVSTTQQLSNSQSDILRYSIGFKDVTKQQPSNDRNSSTRDQKLDQDIQKLKNRNQMAREFGNGPLKPGVQTLYASQKMTETNVSKNQDMVEINSRSDGGSAEDCSQSNLNASKPNKEAVGQLRTLTTFQYPIM